MKFRELTVREIADHVGGTVEGEGDAVIRRAMPIEEAGPGDLTFVANPRYAKLLAEARASAVIVERAVARPPGVTLVRAASPYLAFAKALTLLIEPERPAPGVHPAAWVEPSARLGEGVTVMAHGYVGRAAEVGAGSVLYPGAVVLEHAKVGASCILYPGAVVREACVLGDRVIVHANVSIGSDGFGFAPEGETHFKIPQVGNVVIGDDVEIGSGTCVDRAALGSTRIGAGSKIDDMVMLGHGSRVGRNCILAGGAGLSGSAALGDSVTMGARSGTVGHITVGAGSLIYSTTVVTKPLPERSAVSGNPARPHQESLRLQALPTRLERQLERLQARVDALEAELARAKGGG
ncbi:MAG: UDP-3-O-(3-hydroxymyristoyl)glucosamine N-acyltransferase [Candidatus Lambdaproteobacteria bacterium]|nr:UDP-3-O-(3-hydroxymyristoyl)glucosamine N-acyltransferase [Candidatus Lambdaproteobacteria bacterium]